MPCKAKPGSYGLSNIKHAKRNPTPKKRASMHFDPIRRTLEHAWWGQYVVGC